MNATAPPPVDIDLFVRAYEVERQNSGRASIRDHLPPRAHPGYVAVLTELLRVNLEWEWVTGRRQLLDFYLTEFPELHQHPEALTEVAFEEYRQRAMAGEEPAVAEYAERYGIETGGWEPVPSSVPPPTEIVAARPAPPNREERTPTPEAVAASARVYRQFLAERSTSGYGGTVNAPSAAGLFRDLHQSDPVAAARLAEGVVAFPEVGSDFLGFRLVGELGRGAFGRVYLAEQGELAGRPVALKVTAESTGESQTLAQLQHTNIVPVYSVHRHGAVMAVCMPFFGATTLGDVLQQVRHSGRLPTSGIDLVSTLNNRRSDTRVDSLRSTSKPEQHSPTANSAEPLPLPVKTTDILTRLGGYSYTDAILWIAARLADGLAHAHARGIIHRDLKPANILLTDEGQPMLLDFNLAEDPTAGGAAAARVGGTLPYMAPEHLEAFRSGYGSIDARSDLYSLGLVLFELLAPRPAFQFPVGPISATLSELIRVRRAGAPPLHVWNPNVSPAAGAIIAKCLAPDPERRYQSAAELKEDIERHLANLPLRHAPNPCLRERARKWARRHPRLTSTTTTLGVALGLFLATGAAVFGAWERQQQHAAHLVQQQNQTEATEVLGRLEKNHQLQLAMMYAYDPDTAALERIAAHSSATLASFGVPGEPAWEANPLVTHLTPAGRDRLKQVAGDVALTWADALLLHAERMTDPGVRTEELSRAWQLNEFAGTCLPDDQLGPEYWLQRAKLARGLERPGEAEKSQQKAKELPLRSSRDYFQRAGRHLRQFQFAEALPLLKEATRRDPNHMWAWFALGNCLHQLSQYDSAASCYSTCLALAPDRRTSFFPLFNRSKTFHALGRPDVAKADIDRAVEVAEQDDAGSAAFERAIARYQRAAYREIRKDLSGAETDLTAALNSPELKLQTLLARSRTRYLLKDAKGARADRAEALELTPRDEAGWNDRGLARIADDPKGALADFDEALKINARYHPAMQNKAHVLSECLGKADESITVLGELLDLYPDFGEARIGRAVLLARQGNRKEAHADTTRALARNPKAVTYYQAANVYALTAKVEPADAERVPVLMAFALLAGFGDDVIDSDADMDPVRKKSGFLDTLRIVRQLRKEIGRESK